MNQITKKLRIPKKRNRNYVVKIQAITSERVKEEFIILMIIKFVHYNNTQLQVPDPRYPL
jgi:hypothetical protein